MSVKRVSAAALVIGERKPPAEIQLWNVGENATDYGVHVWNDRSVASVTGRYQARGNPILVDIEHNGSKLDGSNEPAETGGYARLEIRDGAPWLAFEWSDFGREQIATGQRRFLSPEYDVDKTTGEILALYRVSLVADPATHNARVLASAQRVRAERGQPMDLQVILAALRAALSAEDPAVTKESITNLLAELEKAGGGTGEAAPAAAANEGEGQTMAGDPESTEQPPKVEAAAEGDEKKEPVAANARASAKTAAAPPKVAAAAPSTAPDTSVVKVAAAAVRQIEDAQRDHLIATQGERLDPSIRRWASAQPLAIVKGLLDAAPAKTQTVKTGSPTRGAAQGTRTAQLPAEEKADLDRRMGLTRVAASVQREGNRITFGAMTADDAKRVIASRGKEA
ncbi:MAG: hypothetical protein HOW73_05660 [Polyangiaceae bacterium]|nr:hypothetical protein [Polyangiaceae bacterium]